MTCGAVFPFYLPDSGYFYNISCCDHVLLADHLQFVKRSRITRSAPVKERRLSVPTIHSGTPVSISERKISYAENWVHKHLLTIAHFYHDEPYFEEYFPQLELLYKKEYKNLGDFLYALIDFFVQQLHINVNLTRGSHLKSDGVLEADLNRFVKDKNCGSLLMEQLDKIDLLKLGHKIELSPFPEMPVKNTPVLELLFARGPEAARQFQKAV